MIPIEVKDRLKYLRTEILSISQEDFGRKLKLTKVSISNQEKGTRSITDRTIADICREYNVSEDWLRTGKGEIFIETSTEHIDLLAKEYSLDTASVIFLKNFLSLHPNERTSFLKILNFLNCTKD